MARTRTTADLLSAVRARVGAPATDALLSDSAGELLDRIDEEMRSELAAVLVAMRSEYWLRYSTHEVAIVSGTAAYRLPDRAIGQALRDVIVVDESGAGRNVDQVDETERHLYSNGTPWEASRLGFSLENGKVVLLPTPTQSGLTLRLAYYERPPVLIETTAACAIEKALAVDQLKLIVSPTPPSTVTTVAALVDVVRGDGMREAMFPDLQVKTWSTPTLTLEATTPVVVAEVAESTVQNQRVDYLCPRGQTVYPPVPDTLWPALVAIGCRVYCEAIGDRAGAEVAAAIYDKKVKAARSIMEPRVDGEPKRTIPRHTPLRSPGFRGVTRSVR